MAPEADPVEPDPTEPDPSAAPEGSLEALLADMDEDKRKAVLGEVDKARKEAKGLRTRLTTATDKAKKYDDLEAQQQTEAERAATAVKAAEAKAAEAGARIVRAEVKALAGATFADPEDASSFLDLSTYVDDDGEVDTDQITADLAELLKRKPYLARDPGKVVAPRPDPTQGSGGNGKTTTLSPGESFATWIKGNLAK